MTEIKFEKAMGRLEKIVEELEKGELDIDKSLQIFEEGIKMYRVCSKKLHEAEKKIEKLTRNQKGELVAELFPMLDSQQVDLSAKTANYEHKALRRGRPRKAKFYGPPRFPKGAPRT